MTQEQLNALLTSGSFVLTFIALARKIFPKINGGAVYALALIVSFLATFGSAYLDSLPRWAYTSVLSFAIAVMVAGGASFAQSLADRFANKKSIGGKS